MPRGLMNRKHTVDLICTLSAHEGYRVPYTVSERCEYSSDRHRTETIYRPQNEFHRSFMIQLVMLTDRGTYRIIVISNFHCDAQFILVLEHIATSVFHTESKNMSEASSISLSCFSYLFTCSLDSLENYLCMDHSDSRSLFNWLISP